MLTSCAEDFVTWDDVFRPGEETINGVRVSGLPPRPGGTRRSTPSRPSLLADPAGASHRPTPSSGSTCRGRWFPSWSSAAAGRRRRRRRSSIPTSTTRRSALIGRARAPDRPAPGRPRRAGPPPPRLRPGVRVRPTGWSSRPRPNATSCSSCVPVATHASSCSDWASTTRTGDRRPAATPPSAVAGPALPTWSASAGSTGTRGPRCWPELFDGLQGPPPRASPAGAGRPGGRRSRPHHPDIDVVGPVSEQDKWDLLGGRRGPGVPVPVGGLLAGRGRGVERPHPGAGQRRLRRHRRALPAVGWRARLRRLRRVRGGGRPGLASDRNGGRPARASGAGPTSTGGSGGPGSSTATPPSSRPWPSRAARGRSGRYRSRGPAGGDRGGRRPDTEHGGAGADLPDPVVADRERAWTPAGPALGDEGGQSGQRRRGDQEHRARRPDGDGGVAGPEV